MLRHHQALGLEGLDRLPDGHPSHAVTLDQLTLRRQLVAGSELPAPDGLSQSGCDLAVRRALVRLVYRREVGHHRLLLYTSGQVRFCHESPVMGAMG